MLPNEDQLLLRESVPAFNNLARVRGCPGRLSVQLKLGDTKRLAFDFEVLGSPEQLVHLPNPFQPEAVQFEGHNFELRDAYCTGLSSQFGPSRVLRGTARRAVIGNADRKAHSIRFYIPNLRAQAVAQVTERLQSTTTELRSGRQVESRPAGRYLDVPVDEAWHLRLATSEEAATWLEPRSENGGTLLTTTGYLYQPGIDPQDAETISEAREMGFDDAFALLKTLGTMMAFANGGYADPLYIQLHRFTGDSGRPWEPTCGVFSNGRATAINELGTSWVAVGTDLGLYFSRLRAMEDLLRRPGWNDTITFVLEQYRIAIQLVHWHVAVTATAVALERLAFAILVLNEEDDVTRAGMMALFLLQSQMTRSERERASTYWQRSAGRSRPRERGLEAALRIVLRRMGLDVIDTEIAAFTRARNEAVHPRPLDSDKEARLSACRDGLLWLEEALLWSIGYTGQYNSRGRASAYSFGPRYRLDEAGE